MRYAVYPKANDQASASFAKKSPSKGGTVVRESSERSENTEVRYKSVGSRDYDFMYIHGETIDTEFSGIVIG